MKSNILILSMLILQFNLPALAASTQLSPADEASVFKSAGYKKNGNQWKSCDDPSPSYTSGKIEQVADLNGDGLLEAVVTESSAYCYGNTGTSYTLVSKRGNGRWKPVTSGIGVPSFLSTIGSQGWPDLEVGGPGFCFPVERWNGKKYVTHRYQYEGKPCLPK